MFEEIKTRRHFLKTLLSTAGSVAALGPFSKLLASEQLTVGPRIGLPNPYVTSDGRPILVCVNGTNFSQMLDAGLNTIGGLNPLIDNNQDILIKLNCVVAELYPTCSDVNSVGALVEAVRPVTTGQIRVGDAGYEHNPTIYAFLGLDPVVTAAGGELIIFNGTEAVRRESWGPEVPDFNVYSDVYNTPIMINLCNLKRHFVSFYTCALKHHVGSISGPFLGGTRAYIHSFPNQSLEFLQLVAEIAGLVNPELNIVDARQFWASCCPNRSPGYPTAYP